MFLTQNAVTNLSDLFRHCPVAGQDCYRQSANFLTDEQQSALRRRLPSAYRDENIIARIPPLRRDVTGDNVALEKITMGVTQMLGTFIVTSHRFIFLEGERRAAFYCNIPLSDLKTIEKPIQTKSRLVLKFKTRLVPYSLQFIATPGSEARTRFQTAMSTLFATIIEQK